MRSALVLLGATLAVAVAGCGSFDTREWMKVEGQKYTAEEFRRDYRECSKSGKVDDECMKGHGWIAVQPGKAEEKKPDPLTQPAGRGSRR
jgi:hypothetical protein